MLRERLWRWRLHLESLRKLLTNGWIHVAVWVLRIVFELYFAMNFLVGGMNKLASVGVYYAYTIGMFYLTVRLALPRWCKKLQLALLWKVPVVLLVEFLLVWTPIFGLSLLTGALEFNFSRDGPVVLEIENLKALLAPLMDYVPLSLLYYAVIQALSLALSYLNRWNGAYNEVKTLQRDIYSSALDPHLFFNILTTVRSTLTEQGSRTMIRKTTDLVRFYLNKPQDGYVWLKDELAQCEALLSIYRWRYDGKFFVRMEIEEGLGCLKVLPMLVYLLVENICKHGLVQDVDAPASVQVRKEQGALAVRTINRFSKTEFPDSEGVGLPNLRKRLEAAYVDGFNFVCQKSDEVFEVKLLIEMERVTA